MIKEIIDLESYHQGRHACRERYVNSNLLVINPEIDIDELIESPCEGCEHYNPRLKMGCTMVTSCKKKQLQNVAIEIKKHFKTIEDYGKKEH